MYKKYDFKSTLAPYICDYISEKRSLGFAYDSESYILKKFDDYCIRKELKDQRVDKDILNEWMQPGKNEGQTTKTRRVSAVRGLMIYMNTVGINAYIPHHFNSNDTQIPHVMNKYEIIAFFTEIDRYSPTTRYVRLANEYKVMFRLIYSCGLRNSEACKLRFADISNKDNSIRICQSKGRKDRIVYLADDMMELLQQYCSYIKKQLGSEPFWAFPGESPDNPLHNTNIDRKFNEFWKRTEYATKCDKKPTVHGLRHSFVVRRMNTWMVEGVSLNLMMPYLSKYLGHKSINETFYYYHQIEEAFRIIEEKDSISDMVIPEVNDEK